MSDTIETTENVVSQIIPINIYLLWRSAENDKFIIQALLNPETKIPLELIARLSDGTQQDQNPCIYRLQLNLIKDANNELRIQYKNTDIAAKQYQLRTSQKHLIGTSHCEENDFRLINNTDDSHQFLFDVLFRRSPPGKFLRAIKHDFHSFFDRWTS